MLIEKENWDISSGNCGHQCMLCPYGLSTENVGPCDVGICLVILSELWDLDGLTLFHREKCWRWFHSTKTKQLLGSLSFWIHVERKRKAVNLSWLCAGAPARADNKSWRDPCIRRWTSLRAPVGKGRRGTHSISLVLCGLIGGRTLGKGW